MAFNLVKGQLVALALIHLFFSPQTVLITFKSHLNFKNIIETIFDGKEKQKIVDDARWINATTPDCLNLEPHRSSL